MKARMFSWRVRMVLISILIVAVSIIISPIVGIYCIISDYVRYMKVSIKDALCGFVALPFTMGILLYVCCARDYDRILEIVKSENFIDELFKEIGF